MIAQNSRSITETRLPRLVVLSLGLIAATQATADIEITISYIESYMIGDYSVHFVVNSTDALDTCIEQVGNADGEYRVLSTYQKFMDGVEISSVGDTFEGDPIVVALRSQNPRQYSPLIVGSVSSNLWVPVDDLDPRTSVSEYTFQIMLFEVPCSDDYTSLDRIEVFSPFFRIVP